MIFKKLAQTTILPLFFLLACKGEADKKQVTDLPETTKKDAVQVDTIQPKEIEKEEFKLTEENAIEFFFDYQKDLKEKKVRLTTSMGSFIIELFENVPYHRANFIYLTRAGYFDSTQFHRVVKKFIIQGGNSDDKRTAKKRGKIGRYLLPPDTRKGHKHHRGTISMPSSEINNPHMLASPYEFFIVVTKPGSYHLDGNYTPFGKVVEGMDVVDKINNVRVGKGDWPFQNVYITKAEVID